MLVEDAVEELVVGWIAEQRVLERGLDLVRGLLPDAVEPVDEQMHLRPPRLVRRIERRARVALVQVADDLHRVGYHRAAVLDDPDEPLSADPLDRAAIGVVDDHRLDLDPLVRERQRDALDVGRERRAVEPDHAGTVAIRARLPPGAEEGP